MLTFAIEIQTYQNSKAFEHTDEIIKRHCLSIHWTYNVLLELFVNMCISKNLLSTIVYDYKPEIT